MESETENAFDLEKAQELQKYYYKPEVPKGESCNSYISNMALINVLFKDRPEKIEYYEKEYARMREQYKDYGQLWNGVWYQFDLDRGYPWPYEGQWSFGPKR